MKALFLTLILLCSCRHTSTVKSSPSGVRVEEVEMTLSHLNEIEWHVGKRRAHNISQSFTLLIDLPHLNDSDVDILMKHKKTDAWIIRVIVERDGKVQDLGSTYIPFHSHHSTRGMSASSMPTSTAIKVYYAASYASERFRMMNCPAFEHNKKIKEMDIEGSDDYFEIDLNVSSPYNEKSQLVDLAPSSYNAGLTLLGNYYLEIAAYNSSEKILNSKFIRLPQYVSVKKEEQVHITGCEGVHEEYK